MIFDSIVFHLFGNKYRGKKVEAFLSFEEEESFFFSYLFYETTEPMMMIESIFSLPGDNK